MSAEVLSGAGAARRAVFAGAIGAAAPPKGTGTGSLTSSALTPSFAAYVISRLGFGVFPHSTSMTIEFFESLGATDDERLTNFVNEQLSPWLDGNGNVVDPTVDALLAI